MKLLACSVMLLCSLALVTSYPLEQSSNSAIQHVEAKAGSERELVRDKRTVGILRDIFPNFSQIIDRKIQMLTRIIFRLVGRLVLGGGGGGGGGGGNDGDRKVSITLPTYPPSEDDDEDEDEEDSTPAASSSADADAAASQPATTTEQSDEENKVEETKARKKRQAETELKVEPASDTNEVSEEAALEDDEDRDKRFLNFNGGASASANSAGGSGNFLFDVIRLVAGSGNTEETDEASNTPLEGAGSENVEHSKGYDGLGVPGPLTRIFVVANRGVASLIQDLILRLAQTSEKLVNFKARLITSII